jgi:hypothetical protein
VGGGTIDGPEDGGGAGRDVAGDDGGDAGSGSELLGTSTTIGSGRSGSPAPASNNPAMNATTATTAATANPCTRDTTHHSDVGSLQEDELEMRDLSSSPSDRSPRPRRTARKVKGISSVVHGPPTRRSHTRCPADSTGGRTMRRLAAVARHTRPRRPRAVGAATWTGRRPWGGAPPGCSASSSPRPGRSAPPGLRAQGIERHRYGRPCPHPHPGGRSCRAGGSDGRGRWRQLAPLIP